jgi:hypothetical protein
VVKTYCSGYCAREMPAGSLRLLLQSSQERETVSSIYLIIK